MSVARARHLRRTATLAEKKLWAKLRDRRLAGLKFRRQEPIGNRIVDFYCDEARLAVELDGSGHTYDGARTSDLAREQELQSIGIRVIRFFNSAIFDNLDGVLNAIIYEADPDRSLWPPVSDKKVAGIGRAKESAPHLSPLPRGEETVPPTKEIEFASGARHLKSQRRPPK
jgi:adenine-specific DNA-methyltransferase